MHCYQEPRRIFWLRHVLHRIVPSMRRQGLVPEKPLLCAFPNDLIGREMAVAGVYERAGVSTLEMLCSAGVIGDATTLTFIDAGANIGTYSLHLSPRFAQVLAFEPHPITHRILKLNMEINDVSNIELYEIALSDAENDTWLVSEQGNMGSSSLKVGEAPAPEGHRVHTVVGDDYVDRHARHRVGLIKADVEGHEPNLLQGLARTIARDHPLIAFETHHDEHFQRVRHCLDDLGYLQYLALDFRPRIRPLLAQVTLLSVIGVKHALRPLGSRIDHGYSLVLAMTAEHAEHYRGLDANGRS